MTRTTLDSTVTREQPLRTSAAGVLTLLSTLVALLAAIAAGAGLLVPGGQGGYAFTSVHGQAVPMYGQGLYQYDSLLVGSGYRGVDAVVLVIGLPLLAIALAAYRRGSLRGHLVLAGTLGFFLYQYASMAFGAAFNPLFPVYIALFGLSLFAFGAALVAVDLGQLERSVSPRLPARGIAAYLFVVFAVLTVVWGSELAGSLAAGAPSVRMGNYTTVITDVLDLGVILPATVLGGILVLRRTALGYLVASSVLVVCILMGPALAAMSISQLAAGVSFTPGEFVGPVMGFTLVALAGMGVAAIFLRDVDEGASQSRGLLGGSRERGRDDLR